MKNRTVLSGDQLKELPGEPYKDDAGNVMIPLDAFSEDLGLEVNWESVSATASIAVDKKNEIRVQVGSKMLRYNDETVTMAAAPVTTDGTTFVPAVDLCQALSWQAAATGDDMGDLLIVEKTKKELSEDRISDISQKAVAKLGPAMGQVVNGSLILRTGSDKVFSSGADTLTLSDSEQGCAVLDEGGVTYIPLKAGMAALGGTAEYDGKAKWTITYNEKESTISDAGKVKIDGKSVKDDSYTIYQDAETNRFFVSASLYGALIGKNYTDLGNGVSAYTAVPIAGFESQKTYLDTLTQTLTDAAPVLDIPQADAYVALTFDDGPTGSTDDYPNGMTATLLDGLKERGVHATFMMCGYRIKDFNSHMSRYLAEGHELGNHTMDHPDSTLAGLDPDTIREQLKSNDDLIKSYCGQGTTVMRPVGGAVSDNVKAVTKELGYPIINWSVDTEDWKIRDAASVKSAIINSVGDGDIVLMHDLYPTTIEGVLAAIDELQSQTGKTYAFVTVSELAAVKGVTLEPGVVYNDLYQSTIDAINDGTYSPTEF